MRRTLIGPIVIALVAGLLSPGTVSAAPGPERRSVPERVAGEVIVAFKSGTTRIVRRTIGRRFGLTSLQRDHQLGLGLLRIPRGESVSTTVAALEADPAVAFAEPNYTYSLQAAVTANDPFYPEQWALGTGPGSIDAPEAWAVTTGAPGTVVGVVDSGVDLAHPDLIDNLWSNPGEVAGNDVDDDDNGYVDDVHGYDWAQGDADPSDGNGHGTHVAGIVAARGNDGIGVAGTAWQAKFVPLKVLSDSGVGTTLEVAQAFRYAADMGIRVVNASIGGSGYSLTLRRAIADAPETLFVIAAGNGGSDGRGDDNDIYPSYPCDYALANIVCVAASDQQDALTSFSNFGATSVDLAAPGTRILSALPPRSLGYGSGTSMAAPFVAGVAALLWSAEPAATVADVRDALVSGVEVSPALQGKVASGGRLSAIGSLRALAAEPVPPPLEPEPPADADEIEPEPETELPSLDSYVRVTKRPRRLKVLGWVSPGLVGSTPIKVVLKKRRSGGFKRVAVRRPPLETATTTGRSGFDTRFARPGRGRCRVVVRFVEEASGRMTRATTTFRC